MGLYVFLTSLQERIRHIPLHNHLLSRLCHALLVPHHRGLCHWLVYSPRLDVPVQLASVIDTDDSGCDSRLTDPADSSNLRRARTPIKRIERDQPLGSRFGIVVQTYVCRRSPSPSCQPGLYLCLTAAQFQPACLPCVGSWDTLRFFQPEQYEPVRPASQGVRRLLEWRK